MSDVTTVICDNGSEFLKCGFTGDAFPAAVVPSVLAHPATTPAEQAPHIGQDALHHAATDPSLTLTWPTAHGLIHHRPAMAALWRHALGHRLGVDPQQAPARILLTEPLSSSAATRTALLDTMFETLGFQAASIQIQPVLTLLARGSMTGLAVDVGAGVAQVVPVLEGFPYLQHSRKTIIAGREVAAALLELLQRRGHALSPTADLAAVAEAARRQCYVSCDYQQDLQLARETTAVARTYVLPDGRTLRLGAERFKAPEVLFRPHLANKEQPGLSQMAFQCVQDMTIDTRRTLFENVVVSGGCTMLPGLPTRLEADLRQLYLEHTLKGDKAGLQRLKLRVHDAADRKVQVFRGAALLAQIMQDRPAFWITRQEWAEDPARALAKCGVLDPGSPPP